jgi:hypothetical protein
LKKMMRMIPWNITVDNSSVRNYLVKSLARDGIRIIF